MGGKTVEDTLKQILSELKIITTDMSEVKGDISNLKEDMSEVKSDVSVLKEDVTQLKSDMADVKAGQERLQRNIMDSLGTYTEKIIEYFDNKTEVLNKRVYRVETEVERLSRK